MASAIGIEGSSSQELSTATGVKLEGAFTPGPLTFGDSSMDDPTPGPKWEVYVKHKGATAYCWKRPDAQLYAAAPDLFAALHDLVIATRALLEKPDDASRRPHAQHYVTLAEAALAKASAQ